MKKILVLGSIAMMSLASCKKSKQCECSIKNTSNDVHTKIKIPVNGIKNELESACNEYETVYSDSITNVSCNIYHRFKF